MLVKGIFSKGVKLIIRAIACGNAIFSKAKIFISIIWPRGQNVSTPQPPLSGGEQEKMLYRGGRTGINALSEGANLDYLHALAQGLGKHRKRLVKKFSKIEQAGFYFGMPKQWDLNLGK